MKIAYTVEPEDFVAFNLSYMHSNPAMKGNVRNTSIIAAGAVFFGGCILMQFLDTLNVVSVGMYALLAVAMYFAGPRIVARNVRKNVLKMLGKPQYEKVCSEKTLMLTEDEIILTGGGEDSHYEYRAVDRLDEDDGHFYIYVGPMSALIVPLRAFSSGEDKAAFYKYLCEHVKQAQSETAD